MNLGVVNALPLPILDGGQFFFTLYELLLRKKLPKDFTEIVTVAAFGFFVLFSVNTILNDIIKINEPILGNKPITNYIDKGK